MVCQGVIWSDKVLPFLAALYSSRAGEAVSRDCVNGGWQFIFNANGKPLKNPEVLRELKERGTSR
jgi:hypothetical protein